MTSELHDQRCVHFVVDRQLVAFRRSNHDHTAGARKVLPRCLEVDREVNCDDSASTQRVRASRPTQPRIDDRACRDVRSHEAGQRTV